MYAFEDNIMIVQKSFLVFCKNDLVFALQMGLTPTGIYIILAKGWGGERTGSL